MTRRERLERKLEKRQLWAESRQQDATSRFSAAHAAVEHIPFGQSILVGHHSEKRHRAALARHDRNMGKAVESSNMAEHHTSKAAGLESQLENSIFSDDPDAIEALEAKVAGLEAERERMKDINKALKKAFKTKALTLETFPGSGDWIQPPLTADEIAELAVIRRVGHGTGYPSYKLSNLGGVIRNAKTRVAIIKQRQDRSAKAEAAGGVAIEGGEWVCVTFAEKPEREILNALKSAGFHWGGGSWSGKRENLPSCLTQPEKEIAP